MRASRVTCINNDTVTYWRQQKSPQTPLALLVSSPTRYFTDPEQWGKHLDELRITKARHRRIATEGALLGNVMHEGRCRDLVIVSDDAGQFNILGINRTTLTRNYQSQGLDP